MRYIHVIPICLFLLQMSGLCFGVASEFVPMQEKAMGHSLAGSTVTNDSIYSNPAAGAFTNVYSVDGMFLLPKSFAVSVLDAKTSSIVGGLGYFRKVYGGTKEFSQGLRGMLASRVSQNVSVGVSGKMLWGPTNESTDTNIVTDRFNNLDIGTFYNLGSLQLGANLHNMVGEKASMNQSREYSVGGRMGWQETMFMSVAAQAKVSEGTPYEYAVGAEYVSPYHFALKGGYRIQPYLANSFWSVGASFNSPRLSFHYACELPNQTSSEVDHVIGATLLF